MNPVFAQFFPCSREKLQVLFASWYDVGNAMHLGELEEFFGIQVLNARHVQKLIDVRCRLAFGVAVGTD